MKGYITVNKDTRLCNRINLSLNNCIVYSNFTPIVVYTELETVKRMVKQLLRKDEVIPDFIFEVEFDIKDFIEEFSIKDEEFYYVYKIKIIRDVSSILKDIHLETKTGYILIDNYYNILIDNNQNELSDMYHSSYTIPIFDTPKIAKIKGLFIYDKLFGPGFFDSEDIEQFPIKIYKVEYLDWDIYDDIKYTYIVKVISYTEEYISIEEYNNFYK